MIYNLIKHIEKQIAEQRIKHAPKPKGIAPPFQPPIIQSEVKLEKLYLEHTVSFEEMELHYTPKAAALKIAQRETGVKLLEFINENHLGHPIIMENDIGYRFRFRVFIGVNKRLYGESIKSIEAYNDPTT